MLPVNPEFLGRVENCAPLSHCVAPQLSCSARDAPKRPCENSTTDLRPGMVSLIKSCSKSSNIVGATDSAPTTQGTTFRWDPTFDEVTLSTVRVVRIFCASDSGCLRDLGWLSHFWFSCEASQRPSSPNTLQARPLPQRSPLTRIDHPNHQPGQQGALYPD